MTNLERLQNLKELHKKIKNRFDYLEEKLESIAKDNDFLLEMKDNRNGKSCYIEFERYPRGDGPGECLNFCFCIKLDVLQELSFEEIDTFIEKKRKQLEYLKGLPI